MARQSDAAPTPEQLERFNSLLQRIQLADVQLAAASIEGRRDFVIAHGAVEGGVEVGLEISGSGEVVDDGSRIECEMHMKWQAFPPGSDEHLVRVHEVYLVSYALDGDDAVAPETLQAFADHNAAFNVWPFFRESLHSITLRMGLPGYTLPLLKPA
tara:strand:+ start:38 stop:505 length:468 start_codon:yes stop_codon:yes gene_type:complete